MSLITAEEQKLRDEIRQDPDAEQRLQDKCRWEKMTPIAVLRHWGDPRTWRPRPSSDKAA